VCVCVCVCVWHAEVASHFSVALRLADCMRLHFRKVGYMRCSRRTQVSNI